MFNGQNSWTCRVLALLPVVHRRRANAQLPVSMTHPMNTCGSCIFLNRAASRARARALPNRFAAHQHPQRPARFRRCRMLPGARLRMLPGGCLPAHARTRSRTRASTHHIKYTMHACVHVSPSAYISFVVCTRQTLAHRFQVPALLHTYVGAGTH